MAKYTCPSCGGTYNGKKCRNCLYEHFTEEIVHGTHVHKGEPLVIDAPVRRPIKQKDPFGCEKRTKNRHPMAGFLVLLALINTLLPVLRNWGLQLEGRGESHIAPEPETFLPENALLLWEDERIRILADWAGREQNTGTFVIYVENDYSHNVIVSSRDVVVNGYVMEYSGIYCDAYKYSTTRNSFFLDQTDLRDSGIGDIREVSFCLEIYDEDHIPIFTTDTITLTDGTSDHASSAVFGGTEVFFQEGIAVRYLGYSANPFYPEDVSEGVLLFHLENDTDRTLQFYTNRTSTADGLMELFLYRELPPRTKAVARMYLSEMDIMGIQSLAEMTPLTLSLDIHDPDDPDFLILTEPVILPLE